VADVAGVAVGAVQPVLMDLDPQAVKAAAVLGASRLFTFRRVILRALLPAMLTGFALARALLELPLPDLMAALAEPSERHELRQELTLRTEARAEVEALLGG
jgi:Binding-protein-dependent transport system inner membrane component